MIKKDEILKGLDILSSCFSTVLHNAWDNAPDADEEFLRQFRTEVDSAELEFKGELERLKGLLSEDIPADSKVPSENEEEEADGDYLPFF